MAEFVPITSQEEFEAAIKDRINREKRTAAEKYADYDSLKQENETYKSKIADFERAISEANTKMAGHDKIVEGLNARIKGYETDSVKTRMALEYGMPYEMANRLAGETEDEIRADAAEMAKYFKSSKTKTAPLKGTEEPVSGDVAALKALDAQLKGD